MIKEYLGITIDYSRDKSIPEQGYALLTKKGFYKLEHEKSPQESFARAATAYCFGDYDFAQRIYDAVSKGWFTFASPVLSNAFEHKYAEKLNFSEVKDYLQKNVKIKGLPISCFLSYIPDTKEGLVTARSEMSWLSMMGGGIGLYAGMRSPDEKSTGVMSHMRGYDADALSYKQTESRRGSIGAYLDITHPEIMSFIDMRNPVGGNPQHKCFNLNNAINVTNDFMMKVVKGEQYELIDPKHGPTGRFLDAREVWEKIIETRFETGEPYVEFIDTVNSKIPKWITNPAYKVTQSNLCNEIQLMTSEERTAVCCLSSLNLEKFDEWKDTDLVADLVKLLDNVLEVFISLAPKEISRAIFSAQKERAIGLGTLGFHSYLQSKMIPFESGGLMSASQENYKIFSKIKDKAVDASKQLAKERGEPEDCLGSGMRNSHLLAIAPNASSSSLVGASPSIEPFAANAFASQGRAGSFLIKNKYLEKVLDKYSKNDETTWKDIVINNGSVQHLEFLSEEEKAVFKTANEINQQWVIEHAATRQEFVCQGQSINLFVPHNATKQYISDLHMLAWSKGLKGLYYLRSESKVKAKVAVGDGTTQPLNAIKVNVEFNTCLSCEG